MQAPFNKQDTVTITCPHCNFTARIAKARLPSDNIIATCHTCKGRFPISRADLEPPAKIPTPAATTDKSKPDPLLEFTWIEPPPAPKPLYKQRVFFFAIALLLVIISVPKLQTFAEHLRKEHDHKRLRQQVIAEQLTTPSWRYDLNQLVTLVDRNGIEPVYRKDGFNVRCSNDKGIRAEDRSVCWMTVRDLWGVPGIYTASFFDDQGLLNSIRFAFKAGQYQGLSQELSRMGTKLPVDLGTDGKNGPPVEAWLLDSGIIYSSDTLDVQGDIMALFTARPLFAEDICAYRKAYETNAGGPNSPNDTGEPAQLTDDLIAQVEQKWGTIQCADDEANIK